jgi:opacity protein-like surface antigen
MLATPAFAADQPALPWLMPAPESAPPPTAFGDESGLLGLRTGRPTDFGDWRGFYIGGQFGYSDASADFSNSTQAPIAYALRNTALEAEFTPSTWSVLGKATHTAAGFGGFVGYNFQYLTPNAKIILGIEANYDQASLSLTAPNSTIARQLPADTAGNLYAVTISGSGTVTNLDFGTLRARAGWAVGNFLPYAFVGGALGQANVNVAATVTGICSAGSSATCGNFVFTGTAGKSSEWLYGLTVGGGLDFALTRNLFVRAEYEYVQFQTVAGTVLEVNSARVGAGIKF